MGDDGKFDREFTIINDNELRDVLKKLEAIFNKKKTSFSTLYNSRKKQTPSTIGGG